MHRKIVLMIIVMLLLLSCNSAALVETPENNVVEIPENNVVEIPENSVVETTENNVEDYGTIKGVSISEITKDMTIGEVYSLLGPRDYDSQNTVYPFVYHWVIDDSKMLAIVFVIDGCKTDNDFSEKLDEYISSFGNEDEKFEFVNGKKIRRCDAEETLNVIKWVHSNAKAVSAYIEEGNEKTVLFGSAS